MWLGSCIGLIGVGGSSPTLFPQEFFSFKQYCWALSTLWSRGFDLRKDAQTVGMRHLAHCGSREYAHKQEPDRAIDGASMAFVM
jgi:hypothetical protein